MRASVLLLSAAIACGPAAPLPDPTILLVDPSRMLASDAVTINARVDGVLPFQVDFGVPSATANAAAVLSLGDVALPTQPYRPGGRVEAFVASEFEEGVYDLSVALADGRTGVLAQGFTIEPGIWPDSYTVDAIDEPQVAGVPFFVTLRAIGANRTLFRGTVRISYEPVDATPTQSPPFDFGLCTVSVTVPTASAAVLLRVQDLNGGVGVSNPFRVDPAP
jgi:hypothetical protein